MFNTTLAVLVYSATAFASPNALLDFQKYFPETLPPGFAKPAHTSSNVDWAQPALGCVEEMVSHVESAPCLDLSGVANPLVDWPTTLTQPEFDYWYAHRRGLAYCRAEELLKREVASPGSQGPNALELSWMVVESVKNYETKVNAVYEAANQSGVPPLILTGAIYQESLFAELGLADDGGNFSCGVQQINLSGWCSWANTLSEQEKIAMDWPLNIDCSDSQLIDLKLIRPLYEIALTQLNGLPEYQLQASHFSNITQADVEPFWSKAAPEIQTLRFQTIRSFINNCTDPRRGILAKAHALAKLYNSSISTAFKAKDRYTSGDSFHRSCSQAAKDDAFPLHTGWLLTVAAYNAGPRAIDAVAYYNSWGKTEFNDSVAIQDFTPDQIINSIFWSGQYNPTTDKIDYTNLNGSPRSWPWYTACIAQRHIARVIQHVTLLPEYFVNSLDDAQHRCMKSTFDSNGVLISSGVPPDRQISSGRK